MKEISLTKYIPLVLSVLFIGTSGALGRLIHISPVATIFLRSAIGLVILIVILFFQKKSFTIKNRKQRVIVLGSGILLAGHWVAYFYALHLSSVALAMLSMFTYPVFTVLLEPYYLKKSFRFVQLPLALVALLGIYIILPDLDIANEVTLGIVVGIFSALLFAARNLIIKKHGTGINGLVLITHQLAVVCIITLPFIFMVPFTWSLIQENLYYLLFLGVVTTAFGHSAFIKSLEYFSVSTVSLFSNFTPVVGIILGVIFLSEKLSINILSGGALIIFTAIAEMWFSHKAEKK